MNPKIRSNATFKSNPVFLNGIELPDLFPPDGEYDGLWSGYHATFQWSIYEYELDTEDGVRGINCKCVVKIIDKEFFIL
jgi:hypothetical protein